MRHLAQQDLVQVITLAQHSRRQTPPLMAMRMPQQMRVFAEAWRILLVLILENVMLPIRAQLVTTLNRKSGEERKKRTTPARGGVRGLYPHELIKIVPLRGYTHY